ncbi:viral A-type inclusion protein [Histomonas meleagridis]|uniref:viral A-type inclusion protein n=1 Tax=Histomonas meleagridis TaxID=135588 RepID=UPI00355A9912|nr:viral A-type inclusion protein [Histomonas meleagridis]KAH0806708.1 viral A-type inclusion protein [Histomonas meleagridis]
MLLEQLEGSMRFINNIASSEKQTFNTVPLTQDTSLRTALHTQCARIGRFIDENMIELKIPKLSTGKSIFDPSEFNDYLQQIDHIIENSNFRELYALFVGVVQVNSLQSNHIDQLTNKLKEIRQSSLSSEEIEDLEKQLYELQEWKNSKEELIEEIRKILDLNNFNDEELFARINEVVKLNDLLQSQIDELKQNQNILSKEEFDKISNELNNVVEAFNSEQSNNVREIENLKSTLKSKDETIAKLEQTIEDNTCKLQEKNEEINNFKNIQNDTIRLEKSLQEKFLLVASENKTLISNLKRMKSTLKKQNDQLDQYQRTENKLRKAKDSLKEKLELMENQNKKGLEDLNKRNAELSNRYDLLVCDLESEIKELNESKQKISAEKELLAKQKAELSVELTRVKISERSLILKLAALQRQIDIKNSADKESAHMMKRRVEAEKQTNDVQSEVVKEGLVSILEKYYGIIISNEENIAKIFMELELAMKKKEDELFIKKDAYETRKKFGIKQSSSILSTVSAVLQKNNDLTIENDRLKKETKHIKDELSKEKKKSGSMQTKARNSDEWELWGRSIYRQILDGVEPVQNQKELRFLLEEALLAGIGHREIIRKLELMRKEKILISKFPKIEKSKSAADVTSLRPLLLLAVCSRRLQSISGCLPSKITLPSKRNFEETEPNITFSSDNSLF